MSLSSQYMYQTTELSNLLIVKCKNYLPAYLTVVSNKNVAHTDKKNLFYSKI